MKKLIAIVATLALAFALGVGTAVAVAVVTWPSTSTTWAGVNQHLNALHATDGTLFSKVKIVTDVAEVSGGNAQHASARCPAGWTATGGGFRNVDPTSEDQASNDDWFVNNFVPTFPMGPTEVVPNGFSVDFSTSTGSGDPFPVMTVYVICVT